MTDSESSALAVAAVPAQADEDVFDPEIDETIPPFRPGPEPSGLTAGAWLKRWGVGLAGWGVFVLVVYLIAGDHLNGYLSIAGLMVGFLVGLTGMGGGALMTPVLIFVFGFEPTMAIGTDVTYAAVTKIAGSWKHWRQGSVDIPLALWLALGSIPASLIGVAAVAYAKATYGDVINGFLYKAIGSALMMVAVLLIVKVVMHVDAAHRRENIKMTRRLKLMTVLLGVVHRLHHRLHVGRQRHAAGRVPDPVLSADHGQDHRHRHLPRHDPAASSPASRRSASATSTCGWSPRC